MKIALIGYGKMGKMIEQIAISRGHEIVSIIDILGQGCEGGQWFDRLDEGTWRRGSQGLQRG